MIKPIKAALTSVHKKALSRYIFATTAGGLVVVSLTSNALGTPVAGFVTESLVYAVDHPISEAVSDHVSLSCHLLSAEVAERIKRVKEFEYIRHEAERMGVRV